LGRGVSAFKGLKTPGKGKIKKAQGVKRGKEKPKKLSHQGNGSSEDRGEEEMTGEENRNGEI